MRGSPKKSALKMIPKPKGSVGQKGYSLIEHMKLNPEDDKEKGLYNDILVSPQRNSYCKILTCHTLGLRSGTGLCR